VAAPPENSIGEHTTRAGSAGVGSGPRYQIVEEIGRGGMGVVFKAYDTRLRRTVALKRISRQIASAAAERRFVLEAQAAARLSHFNIVHVYEVGVDDEGCFIVMEYIGGQSLRALLRARGALPPHDALDIARQLLDALAEAHAAGLVHRDVKPENVLLTERLAPKLVDFGLAKGVADLAGGNLTMQGAQLGTLAYAAPEQMVDASRVDGRADVYAVGLTLYEMLTGSSPRTLRPDRLPPALSSLVLRMTAENPGDRFPTAAEAAAAVRAALTAASPPAAPIPAVAGGDDPAQRLAREAFGKLQRGLLSEATRTLDRALELNPDCVQARVGRMVALFEAGRIGEAHARFLELHGAAAGDRYVRSFQSLLDRAAATAALVVEPVPMAFGLVESDLERGRLQRELLPFRRGLLNPGDVGVVVIESLEGPDRGGAIRYTGSGGPERTLHVALPGGEIRLRYRVQTPRLGWLASLSQHPPYVCEIALAGDPGWRLAWARRLLSELANRFGRRVDALLSPETAARFGLDRAAELDKWTALGRSLLDN
jgi:predicted Ser/Thr protein kinase